MPAETSLPMTWSARRPQRTLLLGAGFFIASAVVASAVGAMVAGGALLGPGAMTAWLVVLAANFAIIIGLGASVALRMIRLARLRGDDQSAPKLHLRFAGFLSLAAIVPTVVVALFVGVLLLRLVDGWFSERVAAAFDSLAEVPSVYLTVQDSAVRERMRVMALDLNADEVVAGLRAKPLTYAEFLRDQAQVRNFQAVYVIDGQGTILSQAELGDKGAYYVPRGEDFAAADAGQAAVRLDRSDSTIRALSRLSAYDNAYLYTVFPFNPQFLAAFTRAEGAFAAYRETDASRRSLTAFLVIVYVQMALLVVLGAAWFGLEAASRMVAPIGRLVRAAEDVRDGRWDVRVRMDERRDEMAALGRTFNQMTAQLSSQRAELIRATAIAERRREFTEAVLAGVSAGVISLDRQDTITLANAGAATLLGAAEDEPVVGRPLADIAPEFAELIGEVRAGAGVSEKQLDLSRDGQLANLRVRAAHSDDASGGVVVTFDDITRLVSAQRNAAWRDVARRIAHEIKNPLTPIQLSAERLQRKYAERVPSDQDTFDRCLTTILDQVSDIRRMVDEFSTFARMPSPRLARCELNPLVRDAVFAQRVAIPTVSFPVEIDEAEVWTVCDNRLLAQALANVLKNAAESVMARAEEHPGEKAPAGAVRTRLSREGGQAVITVEDNGLGWPVSQKDKLKEPYMTTRGEKGAGLGLAIVNRVMEDHEGRLELDDPTGQGPGAVVRLILPLEDTARVVAAPAASA